MTIYTNCRWTGADQLQFNSINGYSVNAPSGPEDFEIINQINTKYAALLAEGKALGEKIVITEGDDAMHVKRPWATREDAQAWLDFVKPLLQRPYFNYDITEE